MALGQLKDPRAVDCLVAAMQDQDKDWGFGHIAAQSLGKIGDHRAIGPLIAALQDPFTNLRIDAAEALEKVDPGWRGTDLARNAVPKAMSALNDPAAKVRSAAASALGYLRDPRAIEVLLGGLRDEDADVRTYCANALAQMKAARAVQPLKDLAEKDPNPDVRAAGKMALESIGASQNK